LNIVQWVGMPITDDLLRHEILRMILQAINDGISNRSRAGDK
jgi:hypothetical protein